jgi:hypothetical protein
MPNINDTYYHNPQVGRANENAKARSEGKETKEAAQYEDPSEKSGEHCRDCTMFVVPRACTKVSGNIAPGGWCKYYESKESEAQEKE